VQKRYLSVNLVSFPKLFLLLQEEPEWLYFYISPAKTINTHTAESRLDKNPYNFFVIE